MHRAEPLPDLLPSPEPSPRSLRARMRRLLASGRDMSRPSPRHSGAGARGESRVDAGTTEVTPEGPDDGLVIGGTAVPSPELCAGSDVSTSDEEEGGGLHGSCVTWGRAHAIVVRPVAPGLLEQQQAAPTPRGTDTAPPSTTTRVVPPLAIAKLGKSSDDFVHSPRSERGSTRSTRNASQGTQGQAGGSPQQSPRSARSTAMSAAELSAEAIASAAAESARGRPPTSPLTRKRLFELEKAALRAQPFMNPLMQESITQPFNRPPSPVLHPPPLDGQTISREEMERRYQLLVKPPAPPSSTDSDTPPTSARVLL